MSPNALVNEKERLFILNEEIAFAKSQLQPEDTGHIHTAIGWMEHRVKTIQERLENANTK